MSCSIMKIANLQINKALTIMRKQTENQRTDLVNRPLRLGPTIISELDGTLLGRNNLHQLR